MKQELNRHEILEKITPLIENTAMRYNLIPVEIDFVKENIDDISPLVCQDLYLFLRKRCNA